MPTAAPCHCGAVIQFSLDSLALNLDAGRDCQRPDPDPDELRDLVLRQLQDRAGQITVGDPKFIQNREVVCLCDRDQVAGEMSLRPVSMVVPAARDHGRQLTRAIRDGKRLIDARPAHGREGFDFDFGQFNFVVDLGGVAERSELKDPRDRQPSCHFWMIQNECR